MNGFRKFLTATLIALITFLILFGGFSASFQEADLFSPVVAQIPEAFLTEPVIPVIPIEVNPRASGVSDPDFATMTATSISSTCPAPAGWDVIIVKVGDTVEIIAATYKIDPDILRDKNCLLVDDLIPGSRLFVPLLTRTTTPTTSPTFESTEKSCTPPAGWILYTVKQNDTLYSLSIAYNVSVGALRVANCLSSNLITVGKQLYVPNVATLTPIPSPTPKPTKTPTTAPATATAQAPSNTPIPTMPTNTPSPTETPLTPSPTAMPSDTPFPGPTDTPLSSPTLVISTQPFPEDSTPSPTPAP